MLKVVSCVPSRSNISCNAARTVKSIAVLDRTKSPGHRRAVYQDVIIALTEALLPESSMAAFPK